jgi:hypothetical protein
MYTGAQCCGSGSGMNNPGHISERSKNIELKYLRFFAVDPGWKKFGSGMKNLGAGINIPGSAPLDGTISI